MANKPFNRYRCDPIYTLLLTLQRTTDSTGYKHTDYILWFIVVHISEGRKEAFLTQYCKDPKSQCALIIISNCFLGHGPKWEMCEHHHHVIQFPQTTSYLFSWVRLEILSPIEPNDFPSLSLSLGLRSHTTSLPWSLKDPLWFGGVCKSAR